MSLSKDSSLKEVFDYIRDDSIDVHVMPVTLTEKTDENAQMMILIQGKANTAHHIMANLMTAVQDMYDLAEQRNAMPASKDGTIVGTDGEVLSDDGPSLKIVS